MLGWTWVLLASGCGADSAPEQVSTTPPSNPHAQPTVAATTAAAPLQLAVVRETMDSARYTYAKVDVCGTEVWVASSEVKLAVDQVVQVDGALEMRDFHSNSLDRTFPSILFARSLEVSTLPVDCSKGSWVEHLAPAAAPPPAPPAPVAKARQGKVLETMVSGGYRYARVDFCGVESWVAGPDRALDVGQTVTADAGMAMQDFHSSTLDRTFSAIDFVNALDVLPGEPACG